MKEMKAKARKLFAVMLSALMVLSLASIMAFADDGNTGSTTTSNTGSITITNATIGQTYNIYKIFDTDSTGTGNITATEVQKNFYESVMDDEGNKTNPFTFTKNAAGSYNVSVATGKSNAEVVNFLQSFVTNGESGITVNTSFAAVVDAGTAQEADDATVTFSNIPYGYYLVTSSLGAVVTVDSAATVTVIDKNQSGPDWNSGSKKIVTDDGDVTEISANYGDIINYEIEFTATDYDGEKKIVSYEITDTLAAGLSYVLNNDKKTLKAIVTVQGENDEDATTVNATITPTIDEETGVSSFVLTLDWTETTTGDDDVTTYGDFLYESPSTIIVAYSATVTDKAAIAEGGNKNTASLVYYTLDDNGGPTKQTIETKSETTVYTYALAINKIDPQGKGLEGATFTLTNANGDAINVSASTVEGEKGVYLYDADSKSNTVVSPASGLIIIKGLEAGKYTLTETVAPNGYNLLTEAVIVEAQKNTQETTYTSTTITIYKDKDGNVVATEKEADEAKTTTVDAGVAVASVNVVNESGTELPSTGGMGTTMLYVVGGLLIVGAGVALVVRRRMGAAE